MPEVKSYINKLHEYTNSVNFESNDLKEVIKYTDILRSVLGTDTLKTYVMNIPTENLILTRARKNKIKGELFNELGQINYPQPKYIRQHGRANVWQQSRFYCSDNPSTSLFEVHPKEEWITTINIKITKPSLKLLAIDLNTKYKVTGDQNFSNSDIAFNKFLVEKFVQEIPIEKNYLYLPTAILTHLLITDFDGIIYPSAATKFKGENFALKTEIIDKHSTVIEARVLESYNHLNNGHFNVKCLYRSNNFINQKVIDWQTVSCNGHNINETIYH